MSIVNILKVRNNLSEYKYSKELLELCNICFKLNINIIEIENYINNIDLIILNEILSYKLIFNKIKNNYSKETFIHKLIKKYNEFDCPKYNYILCKLIELSNIDLNILEDQTDASYLIYLIRKILISNDRIKVIDLIIKKGGNIYLRNKINNYSFYDYFKEKEINMHHMYKDKINKIIYKYTVINLINNINLNYKNNLYYLAFSSLNYNDRKKINILNMSNNIYNMCNNL